MQNFTHLFVNLLFIAILIWGNIVFYNQEEWRYEECPKVSGVYMQMTTIVFLLLIFGYAQGTYYFAIWMTIVCKLCSRKRESNGGGGGGGDGDDADRNNEPDSIEEGADGGLNS